MGIEPTSSAWKADIIAVILHPQPRGTRIWTETKSSQRTRAAVALYPALFFYITTLFGFGQFIYPKQPRKLFRHRVASIFPWFLFRFSIYLTYLTKNKMGSCSLTGQSNSLLRKRLQVRFLPRAHFRKRQASGYRATGGGRSVVVSTRICGILRGSSNLLAHPSETKCSAGLRGDKVSSSTQAKRSVVQG